MTRTELLNSKEFWVTIIGNAMFKKLGNKGSEPLFDYIANYIVDGYFIGLIKELQQEKISFAIQQLEELKGYTNIDNSARHDIDIKIKQLNSLT